MKRKKNKKNMHAHFVATRPTVGLWEISALNAVWPTGNVPSADFSLQPESHRMFVPNVTKSVISSMSPATFRSAEAQAVLISVCSEKRLRDMNNRKLIGDLLRSGENRITWIFKSSKEKNLWKTVAKLSQFSKKANLRRSCHRNLKNHWFRGDRFGDHGDTWS